MNAAAILVALLFAAPYSDDCEAAATVAYELAEAVQGETPPDAAWEEAYQACLVGRLNAATLAAQSECQLGYVERSGEEFYPVCQEGGPAYPWGQPGAQYSDWPEE